jgi:hypothetical protein
MHEALLMAGLMRRIDEIAKCEGAQRIIGVTQVTRVASLGQQCELTAG